MSTQARKRLSSIDPEKPTPVSEIVKQVNQSGILELPRFLDRKKWTKKEWKHHREAWAEMDRERTQIRRKNLRDERKNSIKIKRIRHHKVMRELRRTERTARLDERKGRKIRRKVMEEDHSELVLAALKSGATTVGQVCKKTGLTAKEARRSLRKLVKKGNVEKPSARRYCLTQPRRRKRLSDIPSTLRTPQKPAD